MLSFSPHFNTSPCWVLTQTLFSFNVIISNAPVFNVWTDRGSIPRLNHSVHPPTTHRKKRRTWRFLCLVWAQSDEPDRKLHEKQRIGWLPWNEQLRKEKLLSFPDPDQQGETKCRFYLIEADRKLTHQSDSSFLPLPQSGSSAEGRNPKPSTTTRPSKEEADVSSLT